MTDKPESAASIATAYGSMPGKVEPMNRNAPPEMELETCHECNGTGQVADYGPMGLDFYGPKECGDCKGSGRLRRSPAFGWRVTELEWNEITQDRGDGTSDLTGDWEADTPWGPYYLELYELPDGEAGWAVDFDSITVASKTDLDEAKVAAQADFAQRILSAVVSHETASGETQADLPVGGMPPHSPELARGLRAAAKDLKSRPPELRGPFKVDPAVLDALTPTLPIEEDVGEQKPVAWRHKLFGITPGAWDDIWHYSDTKVHYNVRDQQPLYASPIPTITDQGHEEGLVERLTKERDEARQEANHLSDELYAIKGFDWPDWASKILNIVRSRSGYDGYDDADGVDLPEEIEEAFTELEREADRHTHEVRASREFQQAKNGEEHYRKKVHELCAEITEKDAELTRLRALLADKDAAETLRLWRWRERGGTRPWKYTDIEPDEDDRRWNETHEVQALVVSARKALPTPDSGAKE